MISKKWMENFSINLSSNIKHKVISIPKIDKKFIELLNNPSKENMANFKVLINQLNEKLLTNVGGIKMKITDFNIDLNERKISFTVGKVQDPFSSSTQLSAQNFKIDLTNIGSFSQLITNIIFTCKITLSDLQMSKRCSWELSLEKQTLEIKSAELNYHIKDDCVIKININDKLLWDKNGLNKEKLTLMLYKKARSKGLGMCPISYELFTENESVAFLDCENKGETEISYKREMLVEWVKNNKRAIFNQESVQVSDIRYRIFKANFNVLPQCDITPKEEALGKRKRCQSVQGMENKNSDRSLFRCASAEIGKQLFF